MRALAACLTAVLKPALGLVGMAASQQQAPVMIPQRRVLPRAAPATGAASGVQLGGRQ